MRVSVFTHMASAIAIFALIPCSHALLKWYESLRELATYAPSSYSLPQGGYGGYTYPGFGPQPTQSPPPPVSGFATETSEPSAAEYNSRFFSPASFPLPSFTVASPFGTPQFTPIPTSETQLTPSGQTDIFHILNKSPIFGSGSLKPSDTGFPVSLNAPQPTGTGFPVSLYAPQSIETGFPVSLHAPQSTGTGFPVSLHAPQSIGTGFPVSFPQPTGTGFLNSGGISLPVSYHTSGANTSQTVGSGSSKLSDTSFSLPQFTFSVHTLTTLSTFVISSNGAAQSTVPSASWPSSPSVSHNYSSLVQSASLQISKSESFPSSLEPRTTLSSSLASSSDAVHPATASNHTTTQTTSTSELKSLISASSVTRDSTPTSLIPIYSITAHATNTSTTPYHSSVTTSSATTSHRHRPKNGKERHDYREGLGH